MQIFGALDILNAPNANVFVADVGNEQPSCRVMSLNFPLVLSGGGMQEGMTGACSPSLERGLAGEAVGLGNRLPSARHVCRPL